MGIVFNPTQPCCTECNECDVPMYKYGSLLEYSKTIVGLPSPSSIILYPANTSLEPHEESSFRPLVTSEPVGPPTYYGEPVDLIAISLVWHRQVVPNAVATANIYNWYSFSGVPTTDFGGRTPSLSWPGVVNFQGAGKGFVMAKNYLRLIDGGSPGNRVMTWLADNNYVRHTGLNTLGQNILDYERAKIVVNMNEDLHLTTPSGTDLYGMSPTNQTSKTYITVLCSGNPYTLVFQCAPNLPAITGGPIVMRRYGFGASNEILTHYSGAEPVDSFGLGYLFYPPIHADFPGSGNYPRGGYSIPKSRWIFTSGYRGIIDNPIETVSMLPNGIPLSNGSMCLTISNLRMGYT